MTYAGERVIYDADRYIGRTTRIQAMSLGTSDFLSMYF